MACKGGSSISFDPATCVLSGTGPDGNPVSYPIGDAIAAKLNLGGVTWDAETCTLTGRGPDGVEREFDIGAAVADKLETDFVGWDPETCILRGVTESGAVESFDIGAAVLAKLPPPVASTFDYASATHIVTHNGSPFQLNCGKFDFDPLTCELSYENEKGVLTSYFIPQDRFIYDRDTCTLTILDAKGGPGIVVPVGVPADEVCLEFVQSAAGCALSFTYKNKAMLVPLPNMLVGCEYTLATNTLRLLTCDGQGKDVVFPKASLNCLTLDDGTQVMAFDNGCPGGQKMFNIPAIKIDTDNLTVAGSVLTFGFGGDGNDATVRVDVCQLVAENCNATISDILPNGFSFVDNAGNPFTLTFANCCTYQGVNGTPLNADAPPVGPAYVGAKADGDTLVECHPNGLSYWTCVEGAWSLDFIKVLDNNRQYYLIDATEIDMAEPPALPPESPRTANKLDGDTVMVCYPNGFCAFTCVSGVWVRDWCKEFVEPPTLQDGGSNLVADDGVTIGPILGKDGNPIDTDSARVFTLGDLADPDRGPVQDIRCVDQTIQATYCDDSQICFAPSYQRRTGGALPPNIVVGDPASDTPLAEFCVDVVLPKCPVNVRLDTYFSYKLRRAGDGDFAGRLVFHPQYSVDGVAWFNMAIGGVDDINYNGQTSSVIGEISFNDWAFTTVALSGAQQICFRLLLVTNGMTAGLADAETMNGTVSWMGMVCCDPATLG